VLLPRRLWNPSDLGLRRLSAPTTLGNRNGIGLGANDRARLCRWQCSDFRLCFRTSVMVDRKSSKQDPRQPLGGTFRRATPVSSGQSNQQGEDRRAWGVNVPGCWARPIRQPKRARDVVRSDVCGSQLRFQRAWVLITLHAHSPAVPNTRCPYELSVLGPAKTLATFVISVRLKRSSTWPSINVYSANPPSLEHGHREIAGADIESNEDLNRALSPAGRLLRHREDEHHQASALVAAKAQEKVFTAFTYVALLSPSLPPRSTLSYYRCLQSRRQHIRDVCEHEQSFP
jgi:hypothetical protein